MGLLDEIGEEQERTQPNRCPVAKVLPEMDKDDRADLEAAMANPALRHVANARALERRGHRVNANGIAAHRGESCACARR